MNKSSRGRGAQDQFAGRVETTASQKQIASKLKALYQAVENEPVPQQFLDLLRRLDEAEGTQAIE